MQGLTADGTQCTTEIYTDAANDTMYTAHYTTHSIDIYTDRGHHTNIPIQTYKVIKKTGATITKV